MGKVLLVDDNEMLLNMYKQQLLHHGHEVTVVNDGLKAWKTIEKGGFHLILMDVMLPKMSGMKILEKISEVGLIKNGLKVIVMTNAPSAEDKDRAEKLGVSAYLGKVETDPDVIAGMVDKALGK